MQSHSHHSEKRLAVVIGSGAIMCAASLGLLKVLQREGIPISLSVGCSAGSIYAAVIALGFDYQTAESTTHQLWTSDIYEGYTAHLRAVLSGEERFTERSGLIHDRVLMERLGNVFGERSFEETRIPLRLVSTDLFSGESVILSSGKILEASFAFHNLAHHAEIIPILPRFDQPVGTFDTHLIPYVIQQGTLAAEEHLPYLKRFLRSD